MIPGITALMVSHRLRFVPAGIIEAGRMNGEKIRHSRKGQINRRAAGGAKGMPLDAASVACDLPDRLALTPPCERRPARNQQQRVTLHQPIR